MKTVVVTKTLKAPIEDVFEAYTDHERLADLPMVISARVTVPGETERNGLGAVREVNGGLIWLREEVVGWERPTLMEYSIIKSRPASTHEVGRVEFATVPGGTRVTWTTRFGLSNRLLAVGEVGFATAFRVIFAMTLAQVERRAIAASRAA